MPAHTLPPMFPDAVDKVAREQVAGLRGEFHDFREEVKADVGALRTETANGLNKIFQRMDNDSRASLQASKSSTSVLAGYAIGVIGLVFTFTTLITQPLRENDSRHTQILDKHDDRAQAVENEVAKIRENLGGVSASLKAHDATLLELARCAGDTRKEVSEINGKMTRNEGRLDGQASSKIIELLRDAETENH